MKKEPWEFSVWFDRKIEENEERKGIIKYRPTDFIATFIVILITAVWMANEPSAVGAIFVILIPTIMIQLSASQRTIISQEKRIRELEKLTQNQRVHSIADSASDPVDAQARSE